MRRAHPAVPSGELDRNEYVLQRSQGGEQMKRLEDEADPVDPEERKLIFSECAQVAAVHADVPGRGPVQSRKETQQRGFSAPRGANDRHELARADVQVDAPEHLQRTPAAHEDTG